MKQLTDYSKMPFGKYKGKRLKHIPAKYILWLGSQFETGYYYDEQKQIYDYYQLNEDILEKELENNNPPKYYGFMTFQEYLNQGYVQRRHGVNVRKTDCVQVIEQHKNNRVCKRIVILDIHGEQYAYFQRHFSKLLRTMNEDGTPLTPSCFIYEED